MTILKKAALAGSALLAIAIAVPAAAQQSGQDKAEVIHWWTSGGESAALQEIVKAFEAKGGVWVDNAIAGGTNARTTAINRIVGGNPPTAMQFNTGRQFEEVVGAGLLNSLDDQAKEEHWADHLPDIFAKAISFDGTVYAVPINIHGANWLFYNIKVLKDAGVEPPQTWDELVAIAPKLQEAGVIPVIQANDTTSENQLLPAVILAVMGPDLYRKVYADADVEALQTPEFRHVAEILMELRKYRDPGVSGRTWNIGTGMVIDGKAAMQIMGDWAKGEFTNANLKSGVDYGCTIMGPDPTIIAGGDVFVFAKTEDAEQKKVQRMLADVMIDPVVQVDFSIKKGSMPVRTDADMSKLDECAQKGMDLIKGGHRLPSNTILSSADLVGAMYDAFKEFMTDPNADEDDLIQLMTDALQQAG